MADGYFATTGKGRHCNLRNRRARSDPGAPASLTQAVRNRSQLIIVTGNTPLGAKNQLQQFDQKGLDGSLRRALPQRSHPKGADNVSRGNRRSLPIR